MGSLVWASAGGIISICGGGGRAWDERPIRKDEKESLVGD